MGDIMISKSKKWALWNRQNICNDGELYMKRLKIFECPAFGIYIHKIFEADIDRSLHDHPWSFMTFTLSGGYFEEILSGYGQYEQRALGKDPYNRVSQKRFGYLPITSFHRIAQIYPRHLVGYVQTLVIHGPRRKNWGFIDPVKNLQGYEWISHEEKA